MIIIGWNDIFQEDRAGAEGPLNTKLLDFLQKEREKGAEIAIVTEDMQPYYARYFFRKLKELKHPPKLRWYEQGPSNEMFKYSLSIQKKGTIQSYTPDVEKALEILEHAYHFYCTDETGNKTNLKPVIKTEGFVPAKMAKIYGIYVAGSIPKRLREKMASSLEERNKRQQPIHVLDLYDEIRTKTPYYIDPVDFIKCSTLYQNKPNFFNLGITTLTDLIGKHPGKIRVMASGFKQQLLVAQLQKILSPEKHQFEIINAAMPGRANFYDRSVLEKMKPGLASAKLQPTKTLDEIAPPKPNKSWTTSVLPRQSSKLSAEIHSTGDSLESSKRSILV